MSIFFVSRLQSEQYLIDLSQEIIVVRTKTFHTTLLCLLLPRNPLFLASRCSLKAICIYSAVSERNIGLTCVFHRLTTLHISRKQLVANLSTNIFHIYIFFLTYFFILLASEVFFSRMELLEQNEASHSEGLCVQPHLPVVALTLPQGPTRLCSQKRWPSLSTLSVVEKKRAHIGCVFSFSAYLPPTDSASALQPHQVGKKKI